MGTAAKFTLKLNLLPAWTRLELFTTLNLSDLLRLFPSRTAVGHEISDIICSCVHSIHVESRLISTGRRESALELESFTSGNLQVWCTLKHGPEPDLRAIVDGAPGLALENCLYLFVNGMGLFRNDERLVRDISALFRALRLRID